MAALFIAGFATPAVTLRARAQACIPVDPATGSQCIHGFRAENNVQFKDLYWSNSCDFEVPVEWKSDKMTGKVWIDRRNDGRNGVGVDQCYFYCGDITWSPVCNGIPKNAMTSPGAETPSQAPSAATEPEASHGSGPEGGGHGVGQAPSVPASGADPSATAATAGSKNGAAGGPDLNPVSSIAVPSQAPSKAKPASARHANRASHTRRDVKKFDRPAIAPKPPIQGAQSVPPAKSAPPNAARPDTAPAVRKQCPPGSFPFLGGTVCVHCLAGKC